MSKYETTFVIDSLQKSENKENILTKVENFIKNNGGEIGEIEDWGKKRLAYEINRKQYGNYYQIHFEGPGNLPGLLEQEYRLEEGILRFLTIISDIVFLPWVKMDTTSVKRVSILPGWLGSLCWKLL